MFLRDGPYFFKGKCRLSLMNGPLSFKNGLFKAFKTRSLLKGLGPLRFEPQGVCTLENQGHALRQHFCRVHRVLEQDAYKLVLFKAQLSEPFPGI